MGEGFGFLVDGCESCETQGSQETWESLGLGVWVGGGTWRCPYRGSNADM